jgi:hypothetical protein
MEQLTAQEIKPETCFVPSTHKGKSRRIAVAPGKIAAHVLHYETLGHFITHLLLGNRSPTALTRLKVFSQDAGIGLANLR